MRPYPLTGAVGRIETCLSAQSEWLSSYTKAGGRYCTGRRHPSRSRDRFEEREWKNGSRHRQSMLLFGVGLLMVVVVLEFFPPCIYLSPVHGVCFLCTQCMEGFVNLVSGMFVSMWIHDVDL